MYRKSKNQNRRFVSSAAVTEEFSFANVGRLDRARSPCVVWLINSGARAQL
jgi:hypothetical protein